MQNTISDVLRTATSNYLSKIDPAAPPPPEQIEGDLIWQTQVYYMTHNSNVPAKSGSQGYKWTLPNRLDPYQVACIVNHLYHVCRVPTAGAASDEDYDLLCIYQQSGPDEGTYSISESSFRRLFRKYDLKMKKKEFEECITILRDLVPRKSRTNDPDLIAVNNGIFNFRTKQLLPFSPDYVFLSKCRIDYDPTAQSPIIHNTQDGTDWEVEDWMHTLSDDPEVVTLLWEILGAIIRPNVSWHRSAWFYSEKGNNGKGTLCELMRQLCGEGTYATIPLADLGKDFALEPLLNASAIIVDENNVGIFIDKAANLKSIITHDVISVNRKFKQPVPYKFYGFMVQCLNEMPRIKDKSDSFFRRQLFIPFEKCFTGQERKYIKDDYLHRPEVLQYVLKRVLHMDYYELSTPDVCKSALEEYRVYNEPVLQFIEEIFPEISWKLLPFQFLYDLFKGWYGKVNPSGSTIGRNSFISDLQRLLPKTEFAEEWTIADDPVRPGDRMNAPEPLIDEYNLKEWMNPLYMNGNPNNRCIPVLKTAYRGLVSKNSMNGNSDLSAS